jgi:hypothetical protein
LHDKLAAALLDLPELGGHLLLLKNELVETCVVCSAEGFLLAMSKLAYCEPMLLSLLQKRCEARGDVIG